MLGPMIRAEVGDTIKIVFRNNAAFPASMHPHGVFYEKSSEGALYKDGTEGKDKEDDGVPTGGTYTYTWEVPKRAGPSAASGLSSAFWMYHSHVKMPRRSFSEGGQWQAQVALNCKQECPAIVPVLRSLGDGGSFSEGGLWQLPIPLKPNPAPG